MGGYGYGIEEWRIWCVELDGGWTQEMGRGGGGWLGPLIGADSAVDTGEECPFGRESWLGPGEGSGGWKGGMEVGREVCRA